MAVLAVSAGPGVAPVNWELALRLIVSITPLGLSSHARAMMAANTDALIRMMTASGQGSRSYPSPSFCMSNGRRSHRGSPLPPVPRCDQLNVFCPGWPGSCDRDQARVSPLICWMMWLCPGVSRQVLARVCVSEVVCVYGCHPDFLFPPSNWTTVLTCVLKYR